jgi:hypothetical protein
MKLHKLKLDMGMVNLEEFRGLLVFKGIRGLLLGYDNKVMIPASLGGPKIVVRHIAHWAAQLSQISKVGSNRLQ